MRQALQIWVCLPFGSLPRAGQTPARPHTCSQVREPRAIEAARVKPQNHNCTLSLPPPAAPPQEQTCKNAATDLTFRSIRPHIANHARGLIQTNLCMLHTVPTFPEARTFESKDMQKIKIMAMLV
ncbi:unnamed protein product [Sphagnum jensenii]